MYSFRIYDIYFLSFFPCFLKIRNEDQNKHTTKITTRITGKLNNYVEKHKDAKKEI